MYHSTPPYYTNLINHFLKSSFFPANLLIEFENKNIVLCSIKYVFK